MKEPAANFDSPFDFRQLPDSLGEENHLSNCHFPLLYSFILKRKKIEGASRDYLRRMYVMIPDKAFGGTGLGHVSCGYPLAILDPKGKNFLLHAHAYDFNCTPLLGTIIHHVYMRSSVEQAFPFPLVGDADHNSMPRAEAMQMAIHQAAHDASNSVVNPEVLAFCYAKEGQGKLSPLKGMRMAYRYEFSSAIQERGLTEHEEGSTSAIKHVGYQPLLSAPPCNVFPFDTYKLRAHVIHRVQFLPDAETGVFAAIFEEFPAKFGEPSANESLHCYSFEPLHLDTFPAQGIASPRGVLRFKNDRMKNGWTPVPFSVGAHGQSVLYQRMNSHQASRIYENILPIIRHRIQLLDESSENSAMLQMMLQAESPNA